MLNLPSSFCIICFIIIIVTFSSSTFADNCNNYNSGCSSCTSHSSCAWCMTNGTAICVSGDIGGINSVINCDSYYWLNCKASNRAFNNNYTYWFCLLIIVIIIVIIILIIVFVVRALRNKNNEDKDEQEEPKSKHKKPKNGTLTKDGTMKKSPSDPHFDMLKNCIDKATDSANYNSLRNGTLESGTVVIHVDERDNRNYNDSNISISSFAPPREEEEEEETERSPTPPAYDENPSEVQMETFVRPEKKIVEQTQQTALNSLRSLEDLMDEYMRQMTPAPSPPQAYDQEQLPVEQQSVMNELRDMHLLSIREPKPSSS